MIPNPTLTYLKAHLMHGLPPTGWILVPHGRKRTHNWPPSFWFSTHRVVFPRRMKSAWVPVSISVGG